VNELVCLVEGERREQAAVATGAFVGFGVVGGLITILFLAAGLAVIGLGLLGATRALRRRHQLGRLLDEKCEIERVERVTWLRRPALRVALAGGGTIMLPTWNTDRERIFEILQRRELPPARVVR